MFCIPQQYSDIQFKRGHKQKLNNVFLRLHENNLKLQPDKYEFLAQFKYLDHRISDSGAKKLEKDCNYCQHATLTKSQT